jgi:MFS family permease
MTRCRGSTVHRLPSAVYWFGATSFANDLASEMVYPLLPAFVTRTLGGGALALGILDGAADTIAAAFKLVSGYLAERPRLRGPLVVGGYGIAALVRPLIAVASAAWHVVALRAVDRVGKGVRTAPRDVLIADATDPSLRGRAFGVHRAADHTGAILGPLLAAGLVALGVSVRQVFWVAVVPGLAAVLLAWVAVSKSASSEQRAVNRADGGDPPLTARRSPLAPLLACLALAAFLRAPETLLILRAQDLGVSIAAAPLLWAALHVVRSLTSYPGGVLADRWGPRRTIAVGWLLYAVLAFLFARAHGPAQAWTVFLAFGLVSGLTESPERALVAALAGGHRRGRGFGWYHGVLSAVALPGAALFGWMYQVLGGDVALRASAIVTLAAILLLGAVSLAGTGPERGAVTP